MDKQDRALVLALLALFTVTMSILIGFRFAQDAARGHHSHMIIPVILTLSDDLTDRDGQCMIGASRARLVPARADFRSC